MPDTGEPLPPSPDGISAENASAPAVPPLIASTPTSAPRSRSGRRLGTVFGIIAAVGAGIWGCNFAFVSHPVAARLEGDPRNAGFTLNARYAYYVQPGTLVLDLARVESAAPIDLLRAAFAAADTLYNPDRAFDRVIFARSGTPVFMMMGKDFQEIGNEMRQEQNPMYLVRTFPQRLYKPSGERAYGTWEGGILGVLGRQMEDVGDVGRTWAGAGSV
jgi:hypothetical protein